MKNLNDYKDEELGITIDLLEKWNKSAEASPDVFGADSIIEYFKAVERLKSIYYLDSLPYYLNQWSEITKKLYGLIMEHSYGLKVDYDNMGFDVYIEAKFMFLSMIKPFLNDQVDLREALEEINFNLWTNGEFNDVFKIMDDEDEAEEEALNEWMMSTEYLIAESEHYAETGEEHFGGLINVEGVLYKDDEVCMPGV